MSRYCCLMHMYSFCCQDYLICWRSLLTHSIQCDAVIAAYLGTHMMQVREIGNQVAPEPFRWTGEALLALQEVSSYDPAVHVEQYSSDLVVCLNTGYHHTERHCKQSLSTRTLSNPATDLAVLQTVYEQHSLHSLTSEHGFCSRQWRTSWCTCLRTVTSVRSMPSVLRSVSANFRNCPATAKVFVGLLQQCSLECRHRQHCRRQARLSVWHQALQGSQVCCAQCVCCLCRLTILLRKSDFMTHLLQCKSSS